MKHHLCRHFVFALCLLLSMRIQIALSLRAREAAGEEHHWRSFTKRSFGVPVTSLSKHISRTNKNWRKLFYKIMSAIYVRDYASK